MNQDGVHWPAPCAASCHAANAAFSLHAFCVPLAWHLILIEPSASCSIHRARDTYAASGSCLGRLRPEPVTCTMGFPVPAPFPASLPHPSHCATLPWLASSPNPRGWTACCGGFTAALQHTYAVFSLHPICKSRVNCNPLRANGLGMPTRPLDELDLSYTDEELRLLENWLVEHQGEWILDFGRKNWCFRGGGGRCPLLQDRLARRESSICTSDWQRKLARPAVALRLCGAFAPPAKSNPPPAPPHCLLTRSR